MMPRNDDAKRQKAPPPKYRYLQHSTKTIRTSSKCFQHQRQIQGTKYKRDDNTGRAYRPKEVDFRKFYRSLYPTCDLQQIVTEDKCYGFVCYHAHREKSTVRLSTKDETLQRFNVSEYIKVI